MKIIYVFGLLLVCLIGAASALIGLRSLDRWCARQLTDDQVEA